MTEEFKNYYIHRFNIVDAAPPLIAFNIAFHNILQRNGEQYFNTPQDVVFRKTDSIPFGQILNLISKLYKTNNVADIFFIAKDDFFQHKMLVIRCENVETAILIKLTH